MLVYATPDLGLSTRMSHGSVFRISVNSRLAK
jgi:hypothetical protein